jgi:two-component system response regulator RegA
MEQGVLLVVEDDQVLRDRLCHAMEQRGYAVRSASSILEATTIVSEELPRFAVVDMRLPDGNGLDFVASLQERQPGCRTIVLTGYGNIPTTVSAIEAGAFDFLAKPVDADELHNALQTKKHDQMMHPFTPASTELVRREHIDATFKQYGGNVSETARRLNMHRRTLQRILGKNAPSK